MLNTFEIKWLHWFILLVLSNQEGHMFISSIKSHSILSIPVTSSKDLHFKHTVSAWTWKVCIINTFHMPSKEKCEGKGTWHHRVQKIDSYFCHVLVGWLWERYLLKSSGSLYLISVCSSCTLLTYDLVVKW